MDDLSHEEEQEHEWDDEDERGNLETFHECKSTYKAHTTSTMPRTAAGRKERKRFSIMAVIL